MSSSTAWWQSAVAPWMTATLESLLPGACAVCEQPHRRDAEGIVCLACRNRLRPLGWPQCARCGHPGDPLDHAVMGTGMRASRPCRWCHRLHPAIRAVRSCCWTDGGSASALLHAFKYRGWPDTATVLANRMARLSWPRDVLEERAALIPIPASADRLRERGYNQAERLADALAQPWRLPVWRGVVRRTRQQASQVRLTPSERAANVSGAFAVPETWRAALRGQHVVVVDDVVTTAATLNAVAEALVAGGARIISGVTFGRAPDPGTRPPSDDSTFGT